ncbi:MAG: aspartate--tRNA ligase [Mycoplasmatota bacterium]|nr:aspartate--tRNA ligase [Mycoplasmatota bacterium]
MKENIYRDLYCGEVNKTHIGKKLKLAGWVNSIRNLGGLLFITLRDETGIVQLISEEGDKYNSLTRESTITITGTVHSRTKDMINPNMKTGEIEVAIESLEVLGESLNVLPFEINHSKDASEETRLKYRYLDLRNEQIHNNIILRSKVIDFIRTTMKDMNFTEIQTPIISTSSPEGARDFVIPSRKFKGKFYALPQAPQIYKQLLMVSGFNKYFQIAPCFRDEDCRADRTLEFYQLDFEMSFATEEDVYKTGERIFYDIFTNFSDKEVSKTPFKRIPYREAMLKYGSDKPDLRNPLIIEDLTDILSLADFAPFKDTTIRAIKVSSIDKSNSWFKQMEEYTKTLGGTLGYIKVNEDMTFKSSLDKFLNDDIRNKLKDRLSLTSGNIIFIVANQNKEKCAKILGQLRIKLGNELDLLKKNCYEFCIINDFPMYEYNEETNTWDFGHNPFSMPKGGMESLKNSNIEDILAYQYDFVCNGCEMSSGAVRNHSISIMKKAFELAGYDEETIKNKFRSLYTAFQYGAPPHAGMAPGIDRIIMLLTGEENLREVQVFPPNVSGQDTLMGGPNELTEQQLRELHIKIRD